VLVSRLYVVGNNADGQLGLGDMTPRLLPHLVMGLAQTPGHDNVAVSAAYDQTALIRACPSTNSTPCSAQGLCYRGGSCYCEEGVRGRDCSIECKGGKQQPCSGHGDQAKALRVAKRLQDSITELAGWQLRRVLLDPSKVHLRADAVRACSLLSRFATSPNLQPQTVCRGEGAPASWMVYVTVEECRAQCTPAAPNSSSPFPSSACMPANIGARCSGNEGCSGTRSECKWLADHRSSAGGGGLGIKYSIVRVMEELLDFGRSFPALLPLFEWAALGTSIEMGRYA
jgi:hypothetical protein